MRGHWIRFAALCLGAGALAPAQVLADKEGWYLGGGAGVNLLEDAEAVGAGDGDGGGGGAGGGGGDADGFLVLPGLLVLFPTGGAGGGGGGGGAGAGGGVAFDAESDTGFGVNGVLGYAFSNGWRTELELGYRENDLDQLDLQAGFGDANGESVDVSGDTSALSLMANTWYNFNTGSRFQPYLGGGIGVAQVAANNVRADGADLFDDDDVVFAYQAGAGVDMGINDDLTVGVGYRYFGTEDPEFDVDSGGEIRSQYRSHQVGAQMRWRFAGGAATAAVLDSDNDGVPDPADQCPDTPAGLRVDTKGCPVDSDQDGVVDGVDQCPGTPRGTKVNGVGCPVEVDGDGDGDGVPDSVDQCPATPAGSRVLSNGCTSQRVEGVNFEFDKAEITPNADRILDATAETLTSNPDLRIEVAGHTDSLGSDSYNQDLSQRRAQAVADALGTRGIGDNRMQVRGYGESQPIADNGSERGRWQNRRVEIKLLNP